MGFKREDVEAVMRRLRKTLRKHSVPFDGLSVVVTDHGRSIQNARGIKHPLIDGKFWASLEGKFYTRWLACGGPELVRQYQFHPKRKWKFDFASYAMDRAWVAIEIDGGSFSRMRGGHSRGVGQQNDAEKRNCATRLGWSVLVFTTKMSTDTKAIQEAVDWLKGRIGK